MFRNTLALFALASLVTLASPGIGRAQQKDIVDTAVAAGSFKTLAKALQAADLVTTLKGAGPFTVFAPTDEAFAKLPAGTVENLLKPENKQKLQRVLTYHVVAGNADSKSIKKAIKAGGGKAEFKTVAGGTLTATIEGKSLVLMDEKGGKSTVTIADVRQSNGVIHVVDTVVLPN